MISFVKENISLNDKCYYRTGGRARWYAEPKNINELKQILLWIKDKNIPCEIIGRGANLLISDSGFKGLIISMSSFENFLRKDGETEIYCGAGLKLDDFVKFSVEEGLCGAQDLSGIPGSVGGAVIMNAGAFSTEIKDIVTKIYVIDIFGKERIFTTDEVSFGYRASPGLNKYIVTGATFSLDKSWDIDVKAHRNYILQRRREKQPLDKPSCGSVFKRPLHGYAGEFIELCGLKGLRRGGAVISEKHANFILNEEQASSADIKWLIDEAIKRVKDKFGVDLEPEVKLIGF